LINQLKFNDRSYATIDTKEEKLIRSRNKGCRDQLTEQVDRYPSRKTDDNKGIISYILKEIDKLDEIKQNLCNAIVDIKHSEDRDVIRTEVNRSEINRSEINRSGINRSEINRSELNSTLNECKSRRSNGRPPTVSESFSDIMMARLLHNDRPIGNDYKSTYSTVLQADTTESHPSLNRSKSGHISELRSNCPSNTSKFSKLEQILEKPRNPNFDRKHQLMFNQ